MVCSIGFHRSNGRTIYSILNLLFFVSSFLFFTLAFFNQSLSAEEITREVLPPDVAQLVLAIEDLNIPKIRKTLKAGANPNFRYAGGKGRSLIGMIGWKQLLNGGSQKTPQETEKKIIEAYDALFEAGGKISTADRDLLQAPVMAGTPQIVKYLIERGADLNAEDGSGETSVTLAFKYGHPEIAEILIEAGAKNIDKKVAAQIRLINAAGQGDLIVVKQELKRGADLNEHGPGGETALTAAIGQGIFKGGNLVMVRELLNLGANPNLRGKYLLNQSPLHQVVFCNEKIFVDSNGPAILEMLLKAGANISSTDSYRKQTPLHIASKLQNVKAASLLLGSGAKVMPRDEDGNTPLDLAESAAMIKLLKESGAKEE